MPSNHHVSTAGWGRRQTVLQFLGAGLHLLPQARGKRAAQAQLAFEAGRKLISLGQAGRQIIVLVLIPVPHLIAVLIAVVLPLVVVIVAVVMFAVAVIVGRGASRQRNRRQQTHAQPFSKS